MTPHRQALSRFLPIWGGLLLILGGFSAPLQACPRADCIRIGSWNIEWLGSERRSQPSDPATIAAMADLIAGKWSLDIVSLQEINTELEGKVQGETYSRRPWRQLEAALHQRGYQTRSGGSGYAQHVVLAWRAPALHTRTPFELGVPAEYDLGEFCRSSRLRKPLAGQFRAGKFDFWFVGLHLKSSVGQTNCSAAIRQQQTQRLLKEVIQLRQTDRDIILAGDFNASQQHKTLQPLLQDGFHALHQRKLRNPHSNHYSYHSKNAKKANSGSLVDHIMVSARHTKEWLPYSANIYTPSDAKIFANTYSDHVPVWVDFSTLHDDD